MVRALVVDDESIIAEDFADQLNGRQGWHASYICDALAVIDILSKDQCDVCFLDIEMPEQSGIALGQQIKEQFPQIIIVFATAYAEHAASAYRLPAADYLVKPISRELLSEACDRVEERLENSSAMEGLDDNNLGSDTIVVKSVGRTDYVKIPEIIMGQAAGNYVRLVCNGKEYLHRCSFSELINQITPMGFMQCHRSFFVNTIKVQSFVRNMNDGDELVLEGDLRVPVSQSHRKSVDQILAHP
ncbi:MAG: LytR/AlgR family response regulator transcription factor [Kordiimonas sp.]